MADYVAIQRSVHLNAGYTPTTDLSFTARMATVPLLKEELPYIIQHMAVGFVKRAGSTNDSFELVGLQSLAPNKNYFVLPDGRWLCSYSPAFYRAHPFALRSYEQDNQLQLSIKSDCIIENPSETDIRFFEEDKTLTPRMQEILTFLTESLRSREATLKLCKALQNANLIVPWSISYTEADENNNPQARTLQGLYHIDSNVLGKLAAEKLAALNACGALSVAYGQFFSEPRLKDLTTLQDGYRDWQDQQSKQNASEPDLDDIFGNKDDLFSF